MVEPESVGVVGGRSVNSYILGLTQQSHIQFSTVRRRVLGGYRVVRNVIKCFGCTRPGDDETGVKNNEGKYEWGKIGESR